MAERVVVAMSGGVDSSVAAALLKAQGYYVVGISLKLWPKELCDTIPKSQVCCSARDIEDARQVAEQLAIPFYVVDASQQFQHEVIDYFVNTYAEGQTPNPCIACNRSIKCGYLWQRAQALGATWLATGHYARVRRAPDGRAVIQEAVDGQKDQSYVLFQLTQEQMRHLLLPLGELSKPQVRAIARESGLDRVAEKPDSQEICFVPAGGYREFLKGRVTRGLESGPIVTREGEVVGQHQGVARYTVGQRKGLGIAAARPLYVVGVDAGRNTVTVGPAAALQQRACRCRDTTWCGAEPPVAPQRVGVKIRYHHPKAPAWVRPLAEGHVEVAFDEPQVAVAPGQAAVFYEGETVVGGGWILPA